MNTLSVELVPRSRESLLADLVALRSFKEVSAINVPDLLTCPIRSWEAIPILREFYSRAIPHIRAIDIDPQRREIFVEKIRSSKTKEILIVSGDVPQQYGKAIYPTTTLKAIEWFKEDVPEIKIYAGVDQYRSGIRKELAYAKDKILAGATGFFTQPFFDLRLMEIWAEQLPMTHIYWGIAPVVSVKSKEGYWETKNQVTFPADFDPSLEWNQHFALKVLEWIKKTAAHSVYFMPIRIDLASYFSGIFS